MNFADWHTDPFAGAADSYDADFSSLPRVAALRGQILGEFEGMLPDGADVLELGCGTGDDACHLAAGGHRVVATDPSEAMLEIARQKAAALNRTIEFRRLRAEDTVDLGPARFHAVFSNFGPLNCVEHLIPLFDAMAYVLRPRGTLLLVFLNRIHVWETVAHLLRGNAREAFRRWTGNPVPVRLSGSVCPTWYHSTGTILAASRKDFRDVRISGLNVLSPPPSSVDFCAHHPDLVRRLDSLDPHIAESWPFNRWGDHVMIICRKRT